MKIGELAKAAGVGIDTVRYYERRGLLATPLREASGYRCYRRADVAPLRFIRRAKQLGFTLTEIRELLALSGRRSADMGKLKATASVKLAQVEAKIVELERIRNGLRALVTACPGTGALDGCPILAALADEEAA